LSGARDGTTLRRPIGPTVNVSGWTLVRAGICAAGGSNNATFRLGSTRSPSPITSTDEPTTTQPSSGGPPYEPIGGSWIGCRIEGLMALGTVRFFERGRIETTINGVRYQIELYRSPDGRSLRSFFPRFLGLA
jgi:hypothetical protein